MTVLRLWVRCHEPVEVHSTSMAKAEDMRVFAAKSEHIEGRMLAMVVMMMKVLVVRRQLRLVERVRTLFTFNSTSDRIG